MLIIGLGYQAQQGKDTLADFLCEARGPRSPFRLVMFKSPFAFALKQEVNQAVETLLGGKIPLELLDQIVDKQASHILKEFPKPGDVQSCMQFLCRVAGVPCEENPDMTDPFCKYGKQRRLLQWWGTEFRRNQDSEYWVNQTRDRLQRLREVERADVAFVTDVRFPNELKMIHDLGGHTICVQRAGYVHAAAQGHVSEACVNPGMFDYKIVASSLMGLKLRGLKLFDELATDKI